MFVIGNFLGALASILGTVINVYMWIIVISALLSFVRPDPYNPIVRTLRALTEPLLYRIRKRFPFVYIGGLDLSPLVLILALQFINIALVRSLADMATRMSIQG
jgi:YggT family protein